MIELGKDIKFSILDVLKWYNRTVILHQCILTRSTICIAIMNLIRITTDALPDSTFIANWEWKYILKVNEICTNNCPSGNLQPSKEDNIVTIKIRGARGLIRPYWYWAACLGCSINAFLFFRCIKLKLRLQWRIL